MKLFQKSIFFLIFVWVWRTANSQFPATSPAPDPSLVTAEQFQYKSIVLGVLIDPYSIPYLDVTDNFKQNYISLINNTITTLNNASFTSLNTDDSSDDDRTNLTKRISTISLHVMDDIYDVMEGIPEISVMFTMLNCDDTHFMYKKMTDWYGPMVHIAITEPGCGRLPDETSITLPLTFLKRNSDLFQLIVDLRAHRILPGWKEAVIINDIESGDELLDVFGAAFSSNWNLPTITQTIYNVDAMSMTKAFGDQIQEVLQKYPRTAPGNFIVITRSTNINRVLETAKRFGMLSILKQWIFISPDPMEQEFSWNYIETKIIDDGVNIAFIMNSSITTTDVENPLDCDTEALLALLSDVVEKQAQLEFDLYLQVSNEEWDIIKPTRQDRVSNITGEMTNRLSESILSVCDKNSSTWNIRAGENGQWGKQIFEVGWWNPLTGLRMTDDILPHVTGGFRGRRIPVTSIHDPPWQIITQTEENDEDGNVTYSGFIFEVLNHMSKDLNFTYTVIEPRAGETWGVLQHDGSWTGMMKMVAENKVVLAAAAFTVTPERSRFVNFTHVIEREAYGFMVNRPQELSRLLLFAAPFSYPVWICIMLTVLIIGPVLYLVHRNSVYYEVMDEVNEGGLFRLKNCCWYVYGAILQQGGIHLPTAISGRMLVGFWWLFVIVTVTTYSGSLVAFLTFPRVESPVNTVKEVTEFDGVDSWGFVRGSVIEDHLKNSQEKEFQILYKHAIIHPGLNSTVLDKIRFHNHAYIDWRVRLQTIIRDTVMETGRCEFIMGAETFFEEKVALAVPKNSPYLPVFNKQIGQMAQTGLLKRWRDRYWPGKDKCSKNFISAGNRKVGLRDMQGSFYILLFGLGISLSVLLVEFCVHRRKKLKMIDTLKVLVASKNGATGDKSSFFGSKQIPFLQ